MDIPAPIDISGINHPNALLLITASLMVVLFIGSLVARGSRRHGLAKALAACSFVSLIAMTVIGITGSSRVERDIRAAIEKTGITVLDDPHLTGKGSVVTVRDSGGELHRYFITVDVGNKVYFAPS